MKKFKIVVFSDLHYAPELPVNNGSKIDRKLIPFAEAILEKITEEINEKIKPEIVINLGDSVEDFNDKEKDLINLKYIWEKYKKINSNFVSCVGNHDLRSMDTREEVEKIFEYEHSTFSLDYKGLHIIVLGTYVNNEIGTAEGGIYKTQFVSNEDLEWLKKDLEQNCLPTIVCLHFGLAEDNMKDNWWFENCPETALLGNRQEVKKILTSDKNILAVFSGHQHWTKCIKENNITYYVLGSLTENINNDGVPDGVYFIVDFDGKTLNVETHHIRL